MPLNKQELLFDAKFRFYQTNSIHPLSLFFSSPLFFFISKNHLNNIRIGERKWNENAFPFLEQWRTTRNLVKASGEYFELGLFRGKIQSVIPGDFWIYGILYLERSECAKRAYEDFRIHKKKLKCWRRFILIRFLKNSKNCFIQKRSTHKRGYATGNFSLRQIANPTFESYAIQIILS